MSETVKRVVTLNVFVWLALISLFGVTQWLAASLRYHPSLGGPWFSLGAFPVYSPVTLLRFSHQYGGLTEVKSAYMLSLVSFLVSLGAALTVRFFLGGKLGRVSENVFGDAAFASAREIKKMGVIGKARGIFLGKTARGEFIRHDGPEHYAVIAPTRSGKGAGIVVPTLLTWRGSCIVYDLKEENFQRTAGARAEFSDIIYFNPNSLNTHHFNPLLEIRPGILEVRDAQNIANMIIEPDRPGPPDHWARTGNSLLTAAILHVLYAAPPEEKNLAGVAALLSRPDKSLTETLMEMLETKHRRDENGKPVAVHPGIAASVREVLNKSPDDKSGVSSTVSGYLGVYRDPLLANATRDSDFTIDQLVNSERPKSLYMVIPAGDIDRLRPVIRIMVNLICRRLTEAAVTGAKRDQEHRHKLLLMLDEFTKLGRLEFFESALGFLAGYGIKGMLVTQSLNEIRHVYGDRTSLLDNTSIRVFYRPETVETAEYISKTLGQTTVSYQTHGESGKKGSPFNTSKNQSLHVASRPLLTPREVMELPDDEALVLIGGGKPIRAKKVTYYRDGALLPLIKPPPTIDRGVIFPLETSWFSSRYYPVEEDDLRHNTEEELILSPGVAPLRHPGSVKSGEELDKEWEGRSSDEEYEDSDGDDGIV